MREDSWWDRDLPRPVFNGLAYLIYASGVGLAALAAWLLTRAS